MVTWPIAEGVSYMMTLMVVLITSTMETTGNSYTKQQIQRGELNE